MFRNFFRVREIYEILSLENDIYLSEIPINCLTFKRHHFTKFMITAKKNPTVLRTEHQVRDECGMLGANLGLFFFKSK